MPEPTDKPKPRIVSRTRYMGYRIEKALLSFAGGLLKLVGKLWFSVPFALFFVWFHGSNHLRWNGELYSLFMLVCLILTMLLEHIWIKAGKAAQSKVENMEPVLPMTPDLANHLPAEESLVRASSEPTQPQQEVLLRPAQAGEETPAEQLLRPSG